ncbi:MAG: dihydrofolate reductase family protein [Gaiellaceae bacterium]
MGKLVVGMFVTLDGVMQAPGAPDEDRERGFEHGGWGVPQFDEDMGQTMDELMGRADALLLGRKTYEIFAAYWPHQDGGDPMAAKLNSVPKYVASRTLAAVDWQNSTLLEGEVADEVPKLKDRYGEVHVAGSGDLVQSLLRHDLVDELQLLIFPVVLGTGKRLFGEGTMPRGLRLADSKTSGSGVTINAYERVGAPEYGSM